MPLSVGFQPIVHSLSLTEPVSLNPGRIDCLVAFVSCLVLHCLIASQQVMFGRTEGSVRDFILSWVREKLPHENISNLDKDWQDGRLICELVNSIQPDLIPRKLYFDKTKAEENTKLGMQIAHDAFGIPQVISSLDVTSSLLDELSLVTYLALFCKHESLTKGSTNKDARTGWNSQGDKREEIPCKAYGTGLKGSELGKVAEFVVELNGAKPTDITIAIECKPLRGAIHEDKPDLSVKPLSRNTYCVKYLPSRPGDYVISILHCGAHILRSPFYLTVPEPNGENAIKTTVTSQPSDTVDGFISNGYEESSPRSQSSETKSPSTSRQSSPDQLSGELRSFGLNETVSAGSTCNYAEGPGLVAGEVGHVSKFTVTTDNTTKGPLSVCISCPAVSIPVPYVKSVKRDVVTKHSVLYIPTEPGAYEVFIKWGDASINGSPFKVYINSVSENIVNEKRGEAADLGGRGRIRIYYSATSTNLKVRKDNELLDRLLKEKGVAKRAEFDPWIALDVGMNKADRDKVFARAGTRRTPMMFVNDVYIGGYEDILILEKQGVFDQYLK